MKKVYQSDGKVGSKPASKKEAAKREMFKMLDKVPKPLARFQLTTSQKFWWNWFGVEMVKTGNFAKLDQIHLQRAAIWLDARCNALKEINKKPGLTGWIQTFNSGASNISPAGTILKDADKALDQISAHFGLSLKDREKLKAETPADPNQTNLFDDFNDRKFANG